MTAGVPGSGIGGFFYLISALLMPVQESVSLFKRKSSRASRRTVMRQVMNAAGVLCGVWLTGWFILRAVDTVSGSVYFQKHRAIFSLLHCINFAYGLITLLSVFLFVQVLSATLRKIHPHTKRPSRIRSSPERDFH